MNGFLCPSLSLSLSFIVCYLSSLALCLTVCLVPHLCVSRYNSDVEQQRRCVCGVSVGGPCLIVLHSYTVLPEDPDSSVFPFPLMRTIFHPCAALLVCLWHVIPCLCTSFHTGSIWGLKICLFCHVTVSPSLSLPLTLSLSLSHSLSISFYTSMWMCHALSSLLLIPDRLKALYVSLFLFVPPSLKQPHGCLRSCEPSSGSPVWVWRLNVFVCAGEKETASLQGCLCGSDHGVRWRWELHIRTRHR